MEAPDTFGGAVRQLLVAHGAEVAQLRRDNDTLSLENSRLRCDLDRLRQELQGLSPSPSTKPESSCSRESSGSEATAADEAAVAGGGDPPPLQVPAGPAAGKLAGPRGASGLARLARALVESRHLDFLIAGVIAANAVTIGVESSHRARGLEVPVAVVQLEVVFLAIYSLELALKFTALGPRGALRSNWDKLDISLVLCGLLDLLMSKIVGANDVLGKILLFRLLRLARLARALRLIMLFRNLYVLVSGLMASVLTLAWTGLLMFVLIYGFAIVGLEILQPDESAGQEYNDVVACYFGGLFDTMLTLLQGVFVDSIGGIYRPLILAKPHLSVYFVSFLLLVSVAMMNLVTAVMVESALARATEDREAAALWAQQAKCNDIKELQSLFHEVDADDSGTISRREVFGAGGEVQAKIREYGEMNTLEEIYQILDWASNGEVRIDEFCAGMLRIEAGTPLELFSVHKLCAKILSESKETRHMLESLTGPVGEPPPRRGGGPEGRHLEI